MWPGQVPTNGTGKCMDTVLMQGGVRLGGVKLVLITSRLQGAFPFACGCQWKT